MFDWVHMKFLSKKSLLTVFFSSIAILLFLDLLTKYVVEQTLSRPYSANLVLEENEGVYTHRNGDIFVSKEVPVLPPFWTHKYTRNYDIGFNRLQFLDKFMSPEAKSTFLKLLQLFAVLLAGFYFFKLKMEYFIPFILILSGGLGNVIDRFLRGYVVDYIKWSIPGSNITLLDPWPIFNLADTFVSIGGVLLFLTLLTEKKKASLSSEKKEEGSASKDSDDHNKHDSGETT